MDKLWIIHGNMDKLTLWIVVRHAGVMTMLARDTFCSKSTFWDAQKTLQTNLPTSWSPFLSLWFFHHVLKKSSGFHQVFKNHHVYTRARKRQHQVFTKFSPGLFFTMFWKVQQHTGIWISGGGESWDQKVLVDGITPKKSNMCFHTPQQSPKHLLYHQPCNSGSKHMLGPVANKLAT